MAGLPAALNSERPCVDLLLPERKPRVKLLPERKIKQRAVEEVYRV